MAYSEDVIQRVWRKGIIIQYYAADDWRKDDCGAWIGSKYYGNRQSPYGWEIDHIQPESEAGGDELSNLRLLQWENNAGKQDKRLVCVVTSSGNENIRTRSIKNCEH